MPDQKKKKNRPCVKSLVTKFFLSLREIQQAERRKRLSDGHTIKSTPQRLAEAAD